MFTVCPKCALTLVVTAADLRVAQGYVRCGRCSNVFNALARLSDDRQPGATGLHPQPSPESPPGGAAAGGTGRMRKPDASPTGTMRKPTDPAATGSLRKVADTASTGTVRQPPPDLSNTARMRQAGDPSGTARTRFAPETPAGPAPASAPAAAPAPAPAATSTPAPSPSVASRPPPAKAQTSETSATARSRQLNETASASPARKPPEAAARPAPLPKSAPVQAAPAQSAPTRPAAAQSAPPQTVPPQSLAAAPAAPVSTPPDTPDEEIPEEALEFKPDSTDVSKVFIEQAPTAQFQAATGTFNALRLEAEDAARAERERARTDTPPATELELVDTQVDVEIDPDVLATMASLGHDSPEPTPEARPEATKAAPPRHPSPPGGLTSALAFVPPSQSGPPGAALSPGTAFAHTHLTPATAAPPAAATAGAGTLVQVTPPTRLTEVVGPDPSRATPFETAQAIRDALSPRKRKAETETDATATEDVPASRQRLWAAGTAALALLLGGQIVNHYRNDLAANAQLNGPLTSIYAAFGVRLTPRWNLGAYEVRQLGASTGAEAPGQITVRASVKNGAGQSQPMPLLRVTLQDRFGNRIAARDVPPQSYLPAAAPGRSQLSAGQRIDAQMDFVDPGSNAVGFEIDACLPAPGGGVACANDPAR